MPVTLITGSNTGLGGRISLVPWRSVEWIASLIPNTRLEIFEADEGGQHFMLLENQQKLNRLVAEFIGYLLAIIQSSNVKTQKETPPMKQILLIALLTATALTAVAQTPAKAKSGADAKAEQEIRQLADEYAKAIRNINADVLAGMLTEDLMLSDSNGALSDKAKFLASMRARVGQWQYEDYHFEDVVIHVYGNAAAINLVIVSKGSTKNGPFNSRLRATGTIVKQKGQWQVASIHNSTIKQPANQ